MEATGALKDFGGTNLLNMLNYAFDEGPLCKTRSQVFLACFTEARDLLTQWEIYACRGAGVSIGFDLRYVRPPQDTTLAVTFAPCLYLLSEKEQVVRSALDGFAQKISLINRQSRDAIWVREQVKTWKMIDGIFGLQFDQAALLKNRDEKIKKMLFDAWTQTLFNLLRVASHCKHESFFAEKEWRLALPRSTNRSSYTEPIRFRGSKPYIESDLFSDGELPIKEVLVGPLCVETSRVEELIRQAGYVCPVIASRVPLRNTATF
jgi:hypothetical protein